MTKKELENIYKAKAKLLEVRNFLTKQRNKAASKEGEEEYNEYINLIMFDVFDLLKPAK